MPRSLSHPVSGIRLLLTAAIFSFVFLFGVPSHSAQPSQLEVEEIYIFDFGKFVHWPSGVDEGLMNICVAASASFSAGLEKILANETVQGRPVELRRLEDSGDESACAIVFVDTTHGARISALLQSLAGKPTLTVSDTPDFLARGGMIQLQLVDKRVRFSVNLDAVNRAHLTMSSELLKVAFSVKGKPAEGSAQ